ncbi:HTH-type transcriptional regulator GltC [Paraburkholderia sediminicola]|uniref:HTH-type transcriptional regulator GltC n=1 Tax=Paraburkholderia sediminicola TaxID=458836 RepID=A0A6J5CPT8_9BURK|nr:LysR family transcriptional regulator [Paraburkholderia sediminicola]CAB3741114.1 HTH-type transcriptional regulator GltC [Paraburkholderia sediminicola]
MSRFSLGTVRAQINAQTLQILLAVEEHGSLTRAAEQVRLVPSALSRRIAELEATIGTQLLRRTPHGAEFTAAGRSVLSHARTILGEIDALADELASFAEGTRGAVRFAGSVFSLTHRLPSDLASFRRTFPQISLEFHTRTSRDVVAGLLKDDIDVGVFASSEVPPGLRAMVYEEDVLTLLIPDHHPLAERESVGLDDIADYELVSSPPGTETRQLTTDQARRRGLRLRSSIEVSSLDAMVLMTRAGLGIAIVPGHAWDAFGPFHGLRSLPIQEHWAHRQIMVAMPASTALATPAGRLFLQLAGQ